MATLATIRTQIKNVLTAALGAGTEVYERVPGNAVLPCVYLTPDEADFTVAMARGTDTWNFSLVVVVPSADNIIGQEKLDPYVDGSGSKSIRQAIWNAKDTLRNTHGFDVHVSAMSNYGGQYSVIGKDHIGATLSLIIHTSGTE